MAKKEKLPKWRTLKIPIGLFERLDDYAESKDARTLGLTSTSQCVASILRQFLEEYESK